MQEWIARVIDAPEFGIAVLPAVFLLGMISAVGSCCNYALLAAVAGFAGSREDIRKKNIWLAGISLMGGAIISLAVLGTLAGHLGGMVGSNFGRYGTVVAGLVIILFGLGALKLFPFRLPSFKLRENNRPRGTFGAAVIGLAVGASSISCTMICCGPLLPVVLGLALIMGESIWGALIMTSFAVGYSLPLAAMMAGISFGRLTLVTGRAVPIVRSVAGVVMIVAGFWMLLTPK